MKYRFEVGEIAVCGPGSFTVGYECEILALPEPTSWRWRDGMRIKPHEYLIMVPGFSSCNGDGSWSIKECHLRKRFPPIPDEVLTIFDGVKQGAVA